MPIVSPVAVVMGMCSLVSLILFWLFVTVSDPCRACAELCACASRAQQKGGVSEVDSSLPGAM